MKRNKNSVDVNTRPVASRYQATGEKIVEFSSPNGGGLMSFIEHEDGTLIIDFYRVDPTVKVRVPKANRV